MPQDPLSVLFVETRFPGRLGAVADWLVRRRGYRCHFYCHQVEPRELWPASAGHGLSVIQFDVGGVARETAVPWTRGLERGLCHAYGAWEVVDARRPRPLDLVLARSNGLGSSLFVPVYQPGLPIVNFFDYYYHPRTNDLAEEDLADLPPEYVHWRRSANAMDLLDLENGVVPWTASRWQRDLYPSEYHDDFVVIPDGVGVPRKPRAPRDRAISIAGRTIGPETRIVSFVARSLDRLRGFDRFVTLAAQILAERTDVLFVAIGAPSVTRMLDVKYHGREYAASLFETAALREPERLWTPGFVAPQVVADLLAATDLHIVPSRPYPVSRSTLEALGSGAVVLAWDSPPIREVVDAGRTALVVPRDDPDAARRAALAALDDPSAHRPIGQAAAELARERFDRNATLPELAGLFARLVGGT